MYTSTDLRSGQLNPERRDFLRKAGAIAALSAFGIGFFTACSEEDSPSPGTGTGTLPPPAAGITVTDTTVTIDLNLQAGLQVSGGWLLIQQAKMLVVNTGNSNFSALTSVCTHEGCDRSWTFSSNAFTCTCHNSRFDTEGNVLNGPATRPLQVFAAVLNGLILTVTR